LQVVVGDFSGPLTDGRVSQAEGFDALDDSLGLSGFDCAHFAVNPGPMFVVAAVPQPGSAALAIDPFTEVRGLLVEHV
jgi:hypothetical protein